MFGQCGEAGAGCSANQGPVHRSGLQVCSNCMVDRLAANLRLAARGGEVGRDAVCRSLRRSFPGPGQGHLAACRAMAQYSRPRRILPRCRPPKASHVWLLRCGAIDRHLGRGRGPTGSPYFAPNGYSMPGSLGLPPAFEYPFRIDFSVCRALRVVRTADQGPSKWPVRPVAPRSSQATPLRPPSRHPPSPQ